MTDAFPFDSNPRWPDLLKDKRIYPFETEVQVRFQDLDTNAHVNNVAMVAMIEEARYRFGAPIREAGYAERYRLVTAAQQIQYLEESFHGAPLTLHIGVGYIGNRSWRLRAAAFQNDVCVSLSDSNIVLAHIPPGETGMPDALRRILLERRLRTPLPPA